MTYPHHRPAENPANPPSSDADTESVLDPIPLPGAAGPLGGSMTGEQVDGIDQPLDVPGQRPPLSTD